MFSNIKSQIKDLAKNAILVAETTLGSGNGQQKKKMAIEYIVKNLPISDIMKSFVSIFLSSFIDDVIEISLQYINALPKEQGD